MIRTQIYLPEDLYRDLKLAAKTSGKNFSSLIREGAKAIIRKKSRRKSRGWEKFIGALKYGPKDLSTRINDIYK